MRFEITPKAFAIRAQGWSVSDNPGDEIIKGVFNPEKGSPTVEPFSGLNRCF
jgi:hypothetical protein